MPTDPSDDRLNLHRRGLLGAGAALALATKGYAMDKPQTGYAEAGDLKVYYEIHGGPLDGRTPMVALPGGLIPIEVGFTPDFIARFSARRPLVLVEPQGHGHTGDRPGPARMEQLSDDLLAVMAHLKIAKAHLMGHSLGGMIATGLAIRHPERVASLCPVSAPYTFDGFLAELVVLQRDPTHAPSAELIPLLPTEADFASWRAVYERVNPQPKTFDAVVEKLNAMLAAWPGWIPAQVTTIKAPTLVVSGDNDFMRIDFADQMAKLIPHARLAVLPDTTHMNILKTRSAWLEPFVEANIARAV